MTTTTDRPRAPAATRSSVRPPVGGSERVRLARLARDASLRVTGVAGADTGATGLWITTGDDQRVDGVRCVAASEGGFDVSLRLSCELVPLLSLGEAVRTAVASAASAAGIAVGTVDVLIADVAEPQRA